MKRMFKYEIDAAGIDLPCGTIPRYVAMQGDKVCVWAEAPVDEPVAGAAVRVVVIPTGGQVPDNGRYLGTVLMHGGSLVFHFYQIGGQDDHS